MANLRQRLRSDQSGFTLVEMIAAMLVFAIFAAILLTSTIGITRAVSKSELFVRSSSAELAVFQSFDRQIRYAESINFPGTGNDGNRYIEFRTGADSTADGTVLCTQWRFVPALKVIQSRYWTDVVGSTKSPWITKISTVVDLGGSTYPFKLVPATNVTDHATQRLVLSISSGTDLVTPGAAISTTFIARNSSNQSPSNLSTHVVGASDTPVCLTTGTRS
ncbi:MAG: type II secretion system protein [Rhodoglobus sp.]